MDTWIIWTLWHVVPLVSVLTGFHCTIIFFLPTEYRIMLAIDHCTVLMLRFLWQVGEKLIHTLLSSFPRFLPVFMSIYIYLEYQHMAVSEVSKVCPISAYR